MDFDDLKQVALESIILEQWLRFYWLEESESGAVKLDVPEDVKMHITTLAPHLWPLVQRLSALEVEPDARRAVRLVSQFLYEYAGERSGKILEDASFREEVARFQVWVARHAEWLDAQAPDFTIWRQWRNLPSAF